MTAGFDPIPKASVEQEARDAVEEFDLLFHAAKASELSGGIIKTELETERQLAPRVQVLGDNVSIVEVGDDTLKERKMISVELADLLDVDSEEHPDDLNAILLARITEELGLDDGFAEKVRVVADKLDATRYVGKRGSQTYYNTSDQPWLLIKQTTKKDGSVLMGALLGGTLTTHVNSLDNDLHWCDGRTESCAVKVPLEDAMRFLEGKIG